MVQDLASNWCIFDSEDVLESKESGLIAVLGRAIFQYAHFGIAQLNRRHMQLAI